jgi:DNA repair/transcription protein MET18/MMS19
MGAIVQEVRFKVFSIVDSFMALRREGMRLSPIVPALFTEDFSVLKTMGKNFLDGYVSLADGEKDPRNLVVAFAIARVILIEFDISAHVEVHLKSMSLSFCTYLLFSPCSTFCFVISLSPSGLHQTIHMALHQKI